MSDRPTITKNGGFWTEGERLNVGDKLLVTGMPVPSLIEKLWSFVRYRYWLRDQNGEYVITQTTSATKIAE